MDADDRHLVEVVVVFEDFDARNTVAIQNVDGTVLGGSSISLLPVVRARIPQQALDNLKRSPGVVSVDRNHKLSTSTQSTSWGVERIGGREAAEAVNDSAMSRVQVAVIDTGIDYDHPDLDGNIAWGVNTVGPNSPTSGKQAADDDNGHGTFAAGVIAAEDNNRGVVGVAPNARLYSIKSLNDSGTGTVMDIIEGIDRAMKGPDGERGTADDADVISMSFGTPDNNQAIEKAIEKASQSAVLIASAGNGGDGDTSTNEVWYPAKYDEVIAVAATNQRDETTQWSAEGSQVELAAPGYDVLSTRIGGYGRSSGTSFAAPHVSGTAALLIGQDLADGERDQTDATIRATLRDTAKDIESAGIDRRSGYGLVRADSAVGVADESASNTAPTIDIAHPDDGDTVDGVLTLRVKATDKESPPSELDVQVRINGSDPVTATYDSSLDAFTINWDTRDVPDDEQYSITARVRDGDGATAEATITVVVNNTNAAPTVDIVSPEQNETIRGQTSIVLTASDAEDNPDALEAEVSINDGPWRTATYDAEDRRYRVLWNASGIAEDTTHTIRARVTDTGGLTDTTSVSVVVDTIDNPPTVSLIEPKNGTTVSGRSTIQVDVFDDRTDPRNLTPDYRIDGGEWRSMDEINGTWQVAIDTLTLDDGNHTVSVRADDGTHEVIRRLEFTVANAELAESPFLNLSAVGELENGEATVDFVLTNEANTSKSLSLLLTEVPDGWEIVSQNSSGTWSSKRSMWLWSHPVPLGDSVAATVTLAPSENASSGEYTVGGVGVDAADNRTGATVTVTMSSSSSQSVLAAIAGEDGRVQFKELLEVIDYYNNREPVPGTDGTVPSLRDVLRVISSYNTGELVY